MLRKKEDRPWTPGGAEPVLMVRVYTALRTRTTLLGSSHTVPGSPFTISTVRTLTVVTRLIRSTM